MQLNKRYRHGARERTNDMSEYLTQAEKKIEDGIKEKLDRYGEVMKADVGAALIDFCRQDEEFAQAVVQGGSFKDCMAAVSKGIGTGISDLKAFRRAVQFYFQGADIRFQMSIDLCASVREEEEKPVQDSIVIDLKNFF